MQNVNLFLLLFVYICQLTLDDSFLCIRLVVIDLRQIASRVAGFASHFGVSFNFDENWENSVRRFLFSYL